jgi:hypothetical protein
VAGFVRTGSRRKGRRVAGLDFTIGSGFQGSRERLAERAGLSVRTYIRGLHAIRARDA